MVIIKIIVEMCDGFLASILLTKKGAQIFEPLSENQEYYLYFLNFSLINSATVGLPTS